jgi:hypothetical protein
MDVYLLSIRRKEPIYEHGVWVWGAYVYRIWLEDDEYSHEYDESEPLFLQYYPYEHMLRQTFGHIRGNVLIAEIELRNQESNRVRIRG